MQHLVTLGGKPMPLVGGGASEIEGETESQARTRWYSAAIIHYTGNGQWSVGLIPRNQSKWEWIENIPIGALGELFADAKFVNCPTQALLERLREA